MYGIVTGHQTLNTRERSGAQTMYGMLADLQSIPCMHENQLCYILLSIEVLQVISSKGLNLLQESYQFLQAFRKVRTA